MEKYGIAGDISKGMDENATNYACGSSASGRGMMIGK